jgi:hypothetical protein
MIAMKLAVNAKGIRFNWGGHFNRRQHRMTLPGDGVTILPMPTLRSKCRTAEQRTTTSSSTGDSLTQAYAREIRSLLQVLEITVRQRDASFCILVAVMCSCPLPQQNEFLGFNIVANLQTIIIDTTR